MPRQLPRSLPLKYCTVFLAGLQDKIGIPIEENVSGAVYPIDRREHVVLPGLRRPLRQIGALAGRSVELVVENVAPGRGIGRRRRGRSGEPRLPGERIAAPSAPSPIVIIMFRRLISGTLANI